MIPGMETGNEIREGATGKKRGPVPGPPRERTTVYLEADLVEWAKSQPGGLSELVRDLLKQEKERRKR
jgi:hypothetical protein